MRSDMRLIYDTAGGSCAKKIIAEVAMGSISGTDLHTHSDYRVTSAREELF